MNQEKLNRISELTQIARERELTEEEISERTVLRREYIAEWRRGTLEVLENLYIVTEDGKKHKVQKKKKK
jgi:uncharacterized protein YnzC (UPF0291/DUF896 family)